MGPDADIVSRVYGKLAAASAERLDAVSAREFSARAARLLPAALGLLQGLYAERGAELLDQLAGDLVELAAARPPDLRD